GSSGRPVHRHFRGLLSVHSRYGRHTRAATKSWHAYPKASDISSPPCLLRLLPAGALAGWALHPLENAAFARRTPVAVSRDRPVSGGSIVSPTLSPQTPMGASDTAARVRYAQVRRFLFCVLTSAPAIASDRPGAYPRWLYDFQSMSKSEGTTDPRVSGPAAPPRSRRCLSFSLASSLRTRAWPLRDRGRRARQ